MIRYVEIENGELTSSVVASSLPVWVAKGWTLKETGAEGEEAAAHGEGSQAVPTSAPVSLVRLTESS